MPRRFTGVIALEGVQTGDGRIIAEGALTWADLPLPLAWLQEEQHSMPAGGVTVGIIDTISRGDGGTMPFAGIIDDDTPEGAEIVRRMDAGLAPFGTRWGVSIDADDYEVELVAPDGLDEDADLLVIASASRRAGQAPFRLGVLDRVIREGEHLHWGPGPITGMRNAAAGDDDTTDGDVLMEASADEIIERATRLRIRGATLCAIPAFDGAYIELDGAETVEAPVDEDEEPVAASGMWDTGLIVDDAGAPILASGFPLAPPVEWFDDPHLEQPTPLTITDDGQVYGHLGTWDACHDGFSDRCVRLPRDGDYAYFTRRGPVMRCREGCEIPVGHLTMDTGHHSVRASHEATEAHYDNTGNQVAYVTAGTDEHGPWVAGCVRPDLSEEEVVRLRASPPSVDMRPRDGRLELRAVLIVNVPGFPVPRALAASGGLIEPAWLATARLMVADQLDHELAPALAAHLDREIESVRTA